MSYVLCGAGAAVVQHGCHDDKRAETGENRGVRSPICGNVLIAETANTDKEMSLRVRPIYPHGLVGF